MSLRLHVLGASGSGTSTLGQAIAENLCIQFYDTDDFYWATSDVPYTVKHDVGDRLAKMRTAFDERPSWVLSGSLCGWGDQLIPLFTHVVFLHVPWEVRWQRLVERERSRYGDDAIKPGGKMHKVYTDFMDWASRYDTAGVEQRSYATHEQWLNRLPRACSILRVEDEALATSSTARLASEVISQLDIL